MGDQLENRKPGSGLAAACIVIVLSVPTYALASARLYAALKQAAGMPLLVSNYPRFAHRFSTLFLIKVFTGGALSTIVVVAIAAV
jgi:hypothetical protein